MKPDGPTNEQEEILLNHFQNSMDKLVQQMISLKKDLYSSFVKAVISKKDPRGNRRQNPLLGRWLVIDWLIDSNDAF